MGQCELNKRDRMIVRLSPQELWPLFVPAMIWVWQIPGDCQSPLNRKLQVPARLEFSRIGLF